MFCFLVLLLEHFVVKVSQSVREGLVFSLSPRRGPQTKGLVKSLDFPTQFVIFTQKCIVDDICDGGREGGREGARFFTFPPAGSTNKRVGKVCLTFLPNS